MKRNITIITATIVLALVIFNFVASRHFARWDLTRNQDYTMASATQQTLRDLKDVVTLRLYFTKDMPPQLLAFNRLVNDTIDEFRRYGGQNIRVEYVDPASSEELEREAKLSGITPAQLNVQGQGKLEVAKIYMGLAAMYGDRKEVIPVIAYPQNLEYDLTSRILKLTRDKVPTIAWWAPPSEGEAAFGYTAFRKTLADRYSVQDVNVQTPDLDPAKHAAVVVVAPKELNDTQRAAIEIFLAEGGQVIALVDTVRVSNEIEATPQASGLDSVLAQYGITVANDLVMDRANAYAVFSGGVVSYQIPYPLWVKLLPKGMDEKSRIVNGLDTVVLPWASSLTVADPLPTGVKVSALAKTTEFAKVQKFADGYHLDPDSVGTAMQQPGGKVETMVALAETEKGAKLFVVGTSRVIQDQFMKQFPQDAMMVANAVDIMAMGEQLVGIRTRSQLAHPLEEMSPVVEQIVKYANIAGGVLLVLVIALVVLTFRRSRRQALKLAYHSK